MSDINTTVLHRHGQHKSPDYVDSGGVAGIAGVSTDTVRPGGNVSGIIERFSKRVAAAETPTSLNLVKAVFPDAIEFTGITHQARGASILIGLAGGAITLGLGGPLIHELTIDGFGNVLYLILLAIVLFFVAMGMRVLISSIRVEFFRPEDEPIIFDRRNRRVYAVLRVIEPGWKGLFHHWPIKVVEYDWDLVDAEHQAIMSTTGSTIHRYHRLVFLVRRSGDDPTIIDSFQVGTSLQVGAESAAPLWEHIRRFMEENGPHLPHGELPILEKAPVTLWESMGAVGPLGPGYLRYWKNHTWVMVFFHLLFPLFLPMFLVWGLCNWLSYKTAIPVQWPQEVRDAVGDAIDHE